MHLAMFPEATLSGRIRNWRSDGRLLSVRTVVQGGWRGARDKVIGASLEAQVRSWLSQRNIPFF